MSSVSTVTIAVGLLLMLGAQVAQATDPQSLNVTRTTPTGGQVSRSGTLDNGTYTGSSNRVGANGGTYNSSVTCEGGAVANCSRAFSGANANGQAYSGTRESVAGRRRAAATTSITGPDGNTRERTRVRRR